MDIVWILAALCAAVLLAVLIIAYICYRMAFYEPDRKPQPRDHVDVPQGKAYEPFRDAIVNWTLETRAMPREDMYITAFDGLKLHGRYYEYAPGAPIELMMHGYRGTAERDLSGGVQRCFKLGRSALIVDQRCSGESGGNIITFGINEHRDCLSWVSHMITRFGPDVKIILTGISMGAATVLTAAGKPLPENVIGVLADCGYDSAKNIIQKVIGDMGLPPKLAYSFVKLGARLFGHFDLEETSPLEAMKTCAVPVILFHGENDDFVPCQMSRNIYEACPSRKKLVTVPGAGHGLSYPTDPEGYRQALQEFFDA
ncbi:MAG: alpha/beta hydrolase [Oscillospiraceae bacterium]|nr:alpha/beta hydrolase [Oscillospiraceae bacterium]